MKVKLFDEEHELDLEEKINDFLENNKVCVLDIKYSLHCFSTSDTQIYCFSAMIIYE